MHFKSDSANQSLSISSGYKKEPKLEGQRRHITSASSALVIGSALGLLQTLFLIFTARPILSYMGVNSVSSISTV